MLKRFNFFSSSEVDAALLSETPRVSSVAGGGSPFLTVGDAEGGVTCVSKALRVVGYVKAHTRCVNLARQLRSKPVLVTLGDGPEGASVEGVSTLATQIKFWAVLAEERVPAETEPHEDGQPGPARRPETVAKLQLLRSFNLGTVLSKEKSKPYWAGDGGKETQFEWPHATCMDVTEDLRQMAIGFSDGHVLLIRSDPFQAPPASPLLAGLPLGLLRPAAGASKGCTLLHEKGHTYTTLQSFKHIGKTSVTGLGFGTKADGTTWLWVATEKNLRSYHTNAVANAGQPTRRASFGKGPRLGEVEPGPELDDEGCAPNCACVARPPSAAAGNLASTQSFSGVLARGAGAPPASPDSASRRVPRRTQFVLAKADRVEFFSPEDPTSVYAVMGEKRRLAWFRDYLIVVSSGAAWTGGAPAPVGPAGTASHTHDVVQLYDFRNKFIALSMPLRGDGVGHAQFLARQWNMLFVVTSTKRVFAFREKDTQTKLEDLFRRNLFATAVSLASTAGCSDGQVMEIHKMYGDHLYSKGSFDDAVAQYCRTIGHIEPSYVIRRFLDSQRIQNLISYLEALHMHPTLSPTGDHTTLLLNCYTKQKSEAKLEAFVHNKGVTKNIDVHAAVAVLRTAHYFEQALMLAREHGEHALFLRILLEEVGRFDESLQYVRSLPVHLADKYLAEYGKLLMKPLPDETTEAIESLCCTPAAWQAREAADEDSAAAPARATHQPDPEGFIHIFVDHPRHLQRFLRCVVERNDGLLASPLVWNTYLELLLRQASPSNEPDEQRRLAAEQEAMAVLKNPSAQYDANHALVLAQANAFKRGQLFLYERLHMFHMLIRHYMEAGDNAAILAKCKTYGGKDPNLWVQVLMYFASQTEGDVEREIQEVLHHIERLRVLPPLMVVEILAANERVTLSTIRPYVMSQLGSAQRLIDEHSSAIQHLKQDSEAMKREIHELRTQPKVFPSTKCNLTGAPLELPTVHFLSGNSYNLASLPGGSAAADAAAVATARTNGPAPSFKTLEDPKCGPEQQSVADIMHKLRQNAPSVDEEFFNQLEISQDGFATVAEYFSKCLFEGPSASASASAPAPRRAPFVSMTAAPSEQPKRPPAAASAPPPASASNPFA